VTKQIVIEMSDARYKEFQREVGEIIGIANYVEADVKIHGLT
jgi:hypothetical protein